MALRKNPSLAILAHEWSWKTPSDTNAGPATSATCAAMTARGTNISKIDTGAHDKAIGSLCAEKLAPEFAHQRAAVACHKITN